MEEQIPISFNIKEPIILNRYNKFGEVFIVHKNHPFLLEASLVPNKNLLLPANSWLNNNIELYVIESNGTKRTYLSGKQYAFTIYKLYDMNKILIQIMIKITSRSVGHSIFVIELRIPKIFNTEVYSSPISVWAKHRIHNKYYSNPQRAITARKKLNKKHIPYVSQITIKKQIRIIEYKSNTIMAEFNGETSTSTINIISKRDVSILNISNNPSILKIWQVLDYLVPLVNKLSFKERILQTDHPEFTTGAVDYLRDFLIKAPLVLPEQTTLFQLLNKSEIQTSTGENISTDYSFNNVYNIDNLGTPDQLIDYGNIYLNSEENSDILNLDETEIDKLLERLSQSELQNIFVK